MPIISTLVSKKLFYEDIVAYYLRYPEVMFMPDSPGFPLNPDDMEDAHKFALSHPKPNMTRGKDVGWQNFVTDSQFKPKVDLGDIQPKGPTLYKHLFAYLKEKQMQEQTPDYGSRPAFLRINLKNVIMRNAYRVYMSGGIDIYEPFIKVPGYLPVSSLVFSKGIDDLKKYFYGPSPSFDTAYFKYTKVRSDYKKFPYILLAREDICTTVPCKQIGIFEFFEADFSKTTTDINLMYTDLGISARNEPKVVVLKCFLRAFRAPLLSDYSYYVNAFQGKLINDKLPPTLYKYIIGDVNNDMSIFRPVDNFSILQKVDDVLNNFGDILTGRFEIDTYNGDRETLINVGFEHDRYNKGRERFNSAGNHNAVFQGFYKGSLNNGTMVSLRRIDNFARYVMHEICQVQNINVSKYPKICACVGRGTDVADMRSAVKNTMYQPICHNEDCIADLAKNIGEREVFQFKPQLPCSKLTVCTKNVNLGFTRYLNYDNINQNCNFAVEYDPLIPAKEKLQDSVAVHFKSTGLVFGMVMIFLLLLFLFCRR